MSLDQIRRLRLFRDLEKSPKPVNKPEVKNRTLTSISQTDNLRRLNKNVRSASLRKNTCWRNKETQKFKETTDYFMKRLWVISKA